MDGGSMALAVQGGSTTRTFMTSWEEFRRSVGAILTTITANALERLTA